ncbi:hypothetical protein PRZ48_002952 [Zasmidium cellare]|uniref:Uncharacterized protein n=1 Tax=Zasmidium cellare TaxID=395010 RepID=A0ABR0EUB2_ZASCE|nr:hypothetical protein PRZ48_002952 [Zasmidium cellare]
MANGKASKNEARLSDVLEAIEREVKEVGDHADKDSQEQFLRKLLVPKYISELGERHIKAEVAKYRSSLISKLKGNTYSLGPGVKGGPGRAQNYGINDLFVLGPRRILKPEFLNKHFDTGSEEASPRRKTPRQSTEVTKASRTATTPQKAGYESPASRRDSAPKDVPFSAIASPSMASGIDTGPRSNEEKKRTAVTFETDKDRPHKHRKTGSESRAAIEPSLEPPQPNPHPKFKLRLKNPGASANASPSRKGSFVAPPTQEAESPAANNSETSFSAASPSVATIPAASCQQTDSAIAPAAEMQKQSTEMDPAEMNSGEVAPEVTAPAETSPGQAAPMQIASASASADMAKPPSVPTSFSKQHSIADHLGPSGPPANPDQIRDWEVRSNVFNKKPISPPTFQPHKDEPQIFPYGDQGWLLDLWKRLENSLWFAMNSLFNEHGFEEKAPSQFVASPGPELRELYETLVGGEGQWETWVVDQKMKGVDCLRQDCTLAGLFGVSIFSMLQQELPWNVQKDLPAQIGERNLRHFEAAMRDIGHDTNNFLRNMAAKQYEDREFQSKVVAQYAKRQLGALVLTLQPHLEKLIKSNTRKGSLGCKKWTEFLEAAFVDAINIKHILQASKMGPFDFPWPTAGVEINLDEHRPFFEMPGTTHTLHTFLPAVRRVMPDKVVIFSPAVVFSWSLPEGEQ